MRGIFKKLLLRQQSEISKGIDWTTIWLYLALCIIGIMSIFAATYRNEEVIQGFFHLRPIIAGKHYI